MRTLPYAFLAFLFCLGLTPASAADAALAAQQVIEKQIQAFLHDDADAAYSFAAPGIAAKFPDKDAFFAMVKKSYQPVYHPGNYAFGRSKSESDDAVLYQEVLITGRDGQDWSAIYQLARQPDGGYKINGVQIVPNTTSKGI
ncbi:MULTISPECIES: DUF4864 domain-containing protein [Rhizobium]|uniref:DUF4864 domain-containing protein n=1 Tax=Rhizobium rhododendri TaxID=2506430 RepID=A0ABY8IM96_9HYPH|nr:MULTISPECIES: DUF4864 domain-containing protein [Rhizobium]MBZ5758015.1 DUF4864 domain-containing protein [Rhizobium sp. VS19-DR96]MBZ5765155.1 DUF4864 domain-containing protein [Rhizobium sp. VS19-DR129.2]MBZ5772698.1 DUF4864 domain-containing protein [Rhizobium sp. VS19-DRK62.2]MBZ5782615.1 DUF4864 domain-containing protein [Rhizobium sp. VS19-DR121]MBZ5800063.1 DUF4864 domain-containing protein [Rhizobium sp. VS19-DR181]